MTDYPTGGSQADLIAEPRSGPRAQKDERKRGWYWIDNAVLDQFGERIGPIGLAIYNVLARWSNSDRQSYPSVSTIAKVLSISQTSARKYLGVLEESGLVKCEPRVSEDGDPSSNAYTLMDTGTPHVAIGVPRHVWDPYRVSGEVVPHVARGGAPRGEGGVPRDVDPIKTVHDQDLPTKTEVPRTPSGCEYSDLEINDFWKVLREAYPKRDGDQKYPRAEKGFKTLVKGGEDPNIIISCARKYRAWAVANGKIGTDKIQQMATWVNGSTWLQEDSWEIPNGRRATGSDRTEGTHPAAARPTSDERALSAGEQADLKVASGRISRQLREFGREHGLWPPPGPPGEELPGVRGGDDQGIRLEDPARVRPPQGVPGVRGPGSTGDGREAEQAPRDGRAPVGQPAAADEDGLA